MQTALGIIGEGMMLGPDSVQTMKNRSMHLGLHEALQPVFKIMSEEFPGHKLVVKHDSAEIITETVDGMIFSEKALEDLRSDGMAELIEALFKATLPVMEERLKDIKKE